MKEKKRPDSIWFKRGTEKINVLIEYERYKPGAIEAKIKNLLIMSKPNLQDLELISLMYWLENYRPAAELNKAFELAKKGFRINGSQFGPVNCPIVFIETSIKKRPPGVIIDNFFVQLFVFGREDKRYIVESLNSNNC